MTEPEKSISEEINKAAGILREGKIIIFPTDTVYGIGCKWNNHSAIERIRQIKASRQNFPVLVSNIRQVHQIAKVNHVAIHLIHKYWPGGLTIILPGRTTKKIGVRMPDSKIVLSLIEKLDSPIVGTSANFHGQKAPASYEELDPKVIKMVDYIIKGDCKNKVESTVVDATTFPVKILREGTLKLNGLEN